mmetsp:Transcript_15113/g.31142  ORF Transcript_15113/g.31142 Transcript_15113/m.31142 type:complete len:98 (+) Transcript_15113:530-823(+)
MGGGQSRYGLGGDATIGTRLSRDAKSMAMEVEVDVLPGDAIGGWCCAIGERARGDLSDIPMHSIITFLFIPRQPPTFQHKILATQIPFRKLNVPYIM